MNCKEEPRIKDSGERMEFTTGAVRDIQKGKGRCDLMPLDVVGKYMHDLVIGHLGAFVRYGDPIVLFSVLDAFRGDDPFKDAPTMFLEVSKHFEEGAEKYGENNWQKGLPVKCYINSAIRHYLKYLRGDKDEPHDRAFVWNILCAIWTCEAMPELNEYCLTRRICPVCRSIIPDGENECPNCRVFVGNPE